MQKLVSTPLSTLTKKSRKHGTQDGSVILVKAFIKKSALREDKDKLAREGEGPIIMYLYNTVHTDRGSRFG